MMEGTVLSYEKYRRKPRSQIAASATGAAIGAVTEDIVDVVGVLEFFNNKSIEVQSLDGDSRGNPRGRKTRYAQK